MSSLVNEQNLSARSYQINWGITVWLLIAHGLAIWSLFIIRWSDVPYIIGLHFITGCLGITLTYHRMLTHKAFVVPKWLERIFSTFAVLALQGSPKVWVAHHRMHHSWSDKEKDPHDSTRGFLFSHLLWMTRTDSFSDDPKMQNKFARDIVADPYYRLLDTAWMQIGLQVALGLVLWAIGGWQLMLSGIFLRLVLLYHSTWLVNSAAHYWGYRNYETEDGSRNNFIVALLSYGEGWHNNHHRYENVAEAGHRWWEFDITMNVIRLLKLVGLATNVQSFKDQQIEDESPSLVERIMPQAATAERLSSL